MCSALPQSTLSLVTSTTPSRLSCCHVQGWVCLFARPGDARYAVGHVCPHIYLLHAGALTCRYEKVEVDDLTLEHITEIAERTITNVGRDARAQG